MRSPDHPITGSRLRGRPAFPRRNGPGGATYTAAVAWSPCRKEYTVRPPACFIERSLNSWEGSPKTVIRWPNAYFSKSRARDDLADDVAAALAANPDAGAFFDSLAQFYRRGYLHWIDATKRRPDQRAERITEMVKLLKAGVKQRP
jgi:hypothetical protein